MRPANLKSKIFLDGGNPLETRQVIKLLGFLDGQTTNPTLISKNPHVSARLEKGEKFTKQEIFNFYRSVVLKLSGLIPKGSISLEVYADANTTDSEMFTQGQQMFTWIPNAHIKYPTTKAGLSAAEISVKAGLRVNMTLCFSEEQAAAVYAATEGATKGQVFVSPFIGRLDDRGENGMDLIKNIIEMYKDSDHHVAVLTASVRNLNHFLSALSLGSDIITAPFAVLKEWEQGGLQIPEGNFHCEKGNLENIAYQKLDLGRDWREFDIAHTLTDVGLEKFANDWNQLIES